MDKSTASSIVAITSILPGEIWHTMSFALWHAASSSHHRIPPDFFRLKSSSSSTYRTFCSVYSIASCIVISFFMFSCIRSADLPVVLDFWQYRVNRFLLTEFSQEATGFVCGKVFKHARKNYTSFYNYIHQTYPLLRSTNVILYLIL